jgi:hypothetical protein
MKYLLNLPLAVAALLQVWFSSLVFMSTPWSGWSDGPSRGADRRDRTAQADTPRRTARAVIPHRSGFRGAKVAAAAE